MISALAGTQNSLIERAFAFSLCAVVVAFGGWFSYLHFFPSHACNLLYEREVSELRAVVQAIQGYRLREGRLPSPPLSSTLDSMGLSQAALAGYEISPDGTFEVHYLSIDGPTIGYTDRSKHWRCVP